MAYLEDTLDMRGGNWHAVVGVGDLRDEAAILAERFRETQPRSGRTILEHLLQNTLVVGDGGRVGHRA